MMSLVRISSHFVSSNHWMVVFGVGEVGRRRPVLCTEDGVVSESRRDSKSHVNVHWEGG